MNIANDFLRAASNVVRTVLLITASLSCANAMATQPNIVLIMADDLGWNDVGYNGSEIRTPRLDALAESGVVLERFYSQPACSLTRAALMTGNSPMRLGIHQPISKHIQTGLPLSETTLADRLKTAGYQTALTGKWHLGFRGAYHPNARGFDYFYGHVTGGVGYWDHVHGGGLDWQRNGKTLRDPGYATHLIANDAVRVIESRNIKQPLFLFASFNAPHLPNEAPEESIAAYNGTIKDSNRKLHAAMVTELDSAIGKIIDSLAEQKILDNTLVWFMSDNGGRNPETVSSSRRSMIKQLVGLYGRPLPLPMLELLRVNTEEGGGDNTPFRWGKSSIYEGGVRVPSLIYWPGKLGPKQLKAMVTVQDFLPTIMSAIDQDLKTSELDGESQWNSVLAGTQESIAPYITQAGEGLALYQFPWKLLSMRNGKQELYNLEDDPTEQLDLATDFPQRVAKMQRVIDDAPRGESIHVSRQHFVNDPDFFGGEEDRPPWSEIANDS